MTGLPPDEALLAATHQALSRHRVRPSLAQTRAFHNALAQGKFEQFRQLFGSDIEQDFVRGAAPAQAPQYQQPGPPAGLPQFGRAPQGSEVFVGDCCIPLIAGEACQVGRPLLLQQCEGGVAVQFASEFEARLFVLRYFDVFSIQHSFGALSRLTARPPAGEEQGATQRSARPQSAGPDGGRGEARGTADPPRPPRENPRQAPHAEPPQRRHIEKFPAKTFVRVLLDEPMSAEELQGEFDELFANGDLFAVYQRDERDYVLLFRDHERRVAFSRKYAKNEGITLSFLKLEEFKEQYFEYSKVWSDEEQRPHGGDE